MKKIYISALFMLNLQAVVYSGQNLQENFGNERQTIINHAVISFPYLTQGFDFLQSQNLVSTTFPNFLDQRLSHNEHEDMNFDQVIIDAEDIVTHNMKDRFLTILDTAIQEEINLDQFPDPVFLYVMEHKDDTMHDMVRLWLVEWNKVSYSLHQAASADNQEIVHILIDAGADVNIKDSDGQTSLHQAVVSCNANIVEILINAGANLNIQDNLGRTALYQAAHHSFIDIIYILSRAGADLNIKNNNGYAALHSAVLVNHRKVVQALIDAGADLDIQNKNGYTALHCVVKNILKLIAQGNVRPALYQTALNNNRKTIEMLIDAGANLNIHDNKGRTVEQRAMISGNSDLIEILAQARQKQEEKADAKAMARFEQLTKKDWR